MTKGLLRSQSRAKASLATIRKVVYTLNAVALTLDGASGVGFGSCVAGHLPQGNIRLLGAVSYLQFAASGSVATLDADWVGDYGVGSTPASDATITAGDVDIIASTELAAATAEVSPRTRGVSPATVGAILDNTDGSLEVNVNLLIDDGDVGADDIAFAVSGEIHLAYIVLGDD